MLELNNIREAGITKVIICGELDIANADDFDQYFADILAADSERVMEIDMVGLDFIDSTGVRSLMSVLKGALKKQLDVRIINIQPMVYEVLETTGLIQLYGKELFFMS